MLPNLFSCYISTKMQINNKGGNMGSDQRWSQHVFLCTFECTKVICMCNSADVLYVLLTHSVFLAVIQQLIVNPSTVSSFIFLINSLFFCHRFLIMLINIMHSHYYNVFVILHKTCKIPCLKWSKICCEIVQCFSSNFLNLTKTWIGVNQVYQEYIYIYIFCC